MIEGISLMFIFQYLALAVLHHRYHGSATTGEIENRIW